MQTALRSFIVRIIRVSYRLCIIGEDFSSTLRQVFIFIVTIFIYCVCRYTYSTYSECTLHCGGGVQTRTVYCINERTSATVDESHCIAQGLRKPTSQEACNQHPCVEYSVGPFGDVCNYSINIYLYMHTYSEDFLQVLLFYL